MTQGSDLIAAERQRQIDAEGYTAEHDAGHRDQLTRAAIVYAHATRQSIVTPEAARLHGWPWDGSYWKPTGDVVRDLTKAGALIAAALDSELARRERTDTDR